MILSINNNKNKSISKTYKNMWITFIIFGLNLLLLVFVKNLISLNIFMQHLIVSYYNTYFKYKLHF